MSTKAKCDFDLSKHLLYFVWHVNLKAGWLTTSEWPPRCHTQQSSSLTTEASMTRVTKKKYFFTFWRSFQIFEKLFCRMEPRNLCRDTDERVRRSLRPCLATEPMRIYMVENQWSYFDWSVSKWNVLVESIDVLCFSLTWLYRIYETRSHIISLISLKVAKWCRKS